MELDIKKNQQFHSYLEHVIQETPLERTLVDARGFARQEYHIPGYRIADPPRVILWYHTFPTSPKNEPLVDRSLRFIREFEPEKGSLGKSSLRLVVEYRRSRPYAVPSEYWPRKLRDIPSVDGIRDIADVPLNRILSLTRQELSDLFNNHLLYSEGLSLRSPFIGCFSFVVKNGGVDSVALNGPGLNLMEDYPSQFVKRVLSVYARVNYTPLSRTTPEEVTTLFTDSQKLKRKEDQFLCRIRETKIEDILKNWEAIFGHTLNTTDFLKLLIQANIDYLKYLKSPQSGNKFEFDPEENCGLVIRR